MASAQPHIRLVRSSEPPEEAPVPHDLEGLFQRYAPYVAAIGLRILGRKDEVDDLVQDVFLAATKGLENIRDPHTTKAWLATIAVRTARRKLKRRRWLSFLSLDEQLEYLDVADPGASPEQRAMLSGIYRALDRLPVEERIAWTLRHVEGEKLDRIALLCGCSLATVKRRVARAHETIREAVDDG